MKDRSIDREQMYPKNLKARRFSDRTVTVRWSLFWAFAVLIILISGTTLTVSLIGTSRLVDNIARSIIDRAQKQTEVELHRLFDPIVQQVAIAHRWVNNGIVKRYDTNALNALFLPGMFHLPQCVSMMVSDMTGYEFTIFRNESGGQLETPVGQVRWLTRDFRPEQWGRKSIWTLWDENGSKKIKQWEKDTIWDEDLVREFAPSGTKVDPFGEKGLVYDPRPRVWHKGARDRYREWTTAEIVKNHQEAIYWTDIDMFFTSKAPGLTASIAVRDPEGELVVIGYDLLLRDLSVFTTALQPTEHGKVFVFTETGRIVGLPRDTRLQDERLMSAPLLKPVESAGIPELAACMKYWRARLSDEPAPFRFEGGGQAWWVAFRPFQVSAERRLWIGVAVPESDFLAAARQNQFVILVIGVAALALATILAGRLSRSLARPLQALVNKSRHIANLDLTSAKHVVSRLIEIEQLSDSLEKMRSSLENHITQRNEAEQALQKARDGLELRVEERTAELKKANDELKREITERKRAEEALQESQQKFRSLVETTSDWIWEVNQKSVYTYSSPNVKDLLGYGPEEVIGRTPFDFMPPVEAERVAGFFRDIIKSRKPFAGLENTNLHKDGRRIVLETSGVPILDEDGNLLGYRGIDRDITKRKRGEEVLQWAKQELTTRNKIAEIFLTIPDEEIFGKVLQVILEAMESDYGIFGYIDEHDVLIIPSMTKDIWEECRVSDKTMIYPREKWRGIWGRALIEKRSLFANEGLHVPEGHVPITRVLVVPVMYAGQVIGLLEVANKSTDYNHKDQEFLETIAGKIAPILNARLQRDRAEEDLRKYQHNLEELVEVRTKELTKVIKLLRQEIEQRKQLEKALLDVSEREQRRIGRELHDSIGQQFTGIAFMTKVLEQKLASRLPDEAANAAEITKLVNRIMDQTRGLAKGLEPVDLDAGSLMSALQEFAATMEHLFDIHCTLKCDKPIPIDDATVAVHLYRIAQEAATNAIKHGGAKNIQIELVYGRNKSVLAVESDGLDFPGMQIKAKGMGLQIMQHRADMVGGSLDIRKGTKGGTIVTCRFPNKKSNENIDKKYGTEETTKQK